MIALRTQTRDTGLCYYPVGWHLNAWHRLVDEEVKGHLPPIPVFDHLDDPYQGMAKANQHTIGSEEPRVIPLSSESVPESSEQSPSKNKWKIGSEGNMDDIVTAGSIPGEIASDGGIGKQSSKFPPTDRNIQASSPTRQKTVPPPALPQAANCFFVNLMPSRNGRSRSTEAGKDGHESF